MKKRYIRNGIVFDPNIESHFSDSSYGENNENRGLYRKGKKKRKIYTGI